MVYTAVDFFLRRTNYLLFQIDALETLSEPVLKTIKEHLELNEQEYTRQNTELNQAVAEHSLAYLKKG